MQFRMHIEGCEEWREARAAKTRGLEFSVHLGMCCSVYSQETVIRAACVKVLVNSVEGLGEFLKLSCC